MATFTQDGIQFTVTNEGIGKVSKFYNNDNGNFNDAGTDGITPFVNAVEIDWNNADISAIANGTAPDTIEGLDNIQTTGQLLKIIGQKSSPIIAKVA